MAPYYAMPMLLKKSQRDRALHPIEENQMAKESLPES